MKRLSVVIVDDERAARNEIRRLLEPFPDFIVVGEAKDIDEAKLKIEELKPDVIFLDIQMPGGSGFDLLESLDHLPEVVFSTAFDEYAVQAFEMNALDYLMKPIRDERFSKAIAKVLDRRLMTTQKIFIKDGINIHIISIDKIRIVEAKENYACIHFENKRILTKCSLNKMEEKLNDSTFFRINRTQIINTNFVESIKLNKNIKLTSGEILEISERQLAKFKNTYRI